MDDLLNRLDRLERREMLTREQLTRLDREAARGRRAAENAENGAWMRRLDPGSLAGVVASRGGLPDRIPDLGQPLLSRLRDDASLGATSGGRTDPTGGYGNALDDPTFDTVISATIGTAYTLLGPVWQTKYVLNSGTVATTRTVAPVVKRGAYNNNNTSSALASLTLSFGVDASDMTIYLTPQSSGNIGGYGVESPSWVTVAVRAAVYSLTNVTATAYMEIEDGSGNVLASGDVADMASLLDIKEATRLDTAYEGPVIGSPYRWRLRVDVTKTAGSVGSVVLILAEPLWALSDDGSVPMYTPAVGGWWPGVPGRQLVSLPFVAANLAAGATTDLQYADDAMGLGFPRVTMPWEGSIVGASYRMDGVLTAGTLAIHALVNSASVWTPFSLTSASANNDAVSQPPFTDIFTNFDNVGMWVVTNGAFLPTTRDITCTLWVLVDYTGS